MTARFPLLFALDPSVRSAGCAVFRDGVVASAWRTTFTMPEETNVGQGQRWKNIAWWLLSDAYRERGGNIPFSCFVWERPQIYRASKSKGDPNDLIGLAAIGNGVAAILDAGTILAPTPAEWAGQIKKATKGSAWKSPRGMRIQSRLTPAELALVPDQHDVVDAVGLGLWALGRLEVTRVYSSA